MITHCICLRKSFAELKEKNFTSVRQVMDETRCGTKCRKCVPYLIQMIKTGETLFDGVLDIRQKKRNIDSNGKLHRHIKDIPA
jgi:bacterioferritin-associated ferredoxin